MPKLLVNLLVRQTVPHMKTPDLYVLILRTFLRTGLRWLIKDHTACGDICSKAHDPKLHAWDHGYGDNGLFPSLKKKNDLLRGVYTP